MDNYDDYPASEPIPEPEAMHGSLMSFLTGNKDMRKTARSALKQGLWAGGGAIGGGLIFGPVGGMIGGIAGSVMGFVKADEYEGIVVQVGKLNAQQRNFLLAEVGNVLVAAGATTHHLSSADNFSKALYAYAENDDVRNKVWKACVNSLQQ